MPGSTSQDEADEIMREIVALLPFAVELDAVMGYTGALFIDLGRRGSVDDPPDTAGIDLEVEPVVWMFDVEGGRETIASNLDRFASAEEVARWIAAEAQRFDSPATHSLN
ncbi:hypothetical protein [Rathayibacter rathayi]|uniref:hypothetical protein n=1 Tax=Rathayibacter rathayi TaxID=33887 RepID=UPI000CE776F1|nr:hypothetical protein [Rathayibacter rathayi]PPG94298.1 hypothetical protein C5C22_08940 [Rathayibacter rathayi]